MYRLLGEPTGALASAFRAVLLVRRPRPSFKRIHMVRLNQLPSVLVPKASRIRAFKAEG